MAKNLKIKNRFICFTGIDGSGKTTACKMSIKMLEKKGMKYDYVYCGWRRFNSLFLVPFVTLLRRSNTLVSNNSGNKKLNYLKNRFPALFQNVVLADYFLSIIFNIKIPLMLGRNIVCDRYVYDVIIGLGIDLGYPDKKIMKILKNFLYIVPEPDIIFLLDVPEEISFIRKDDVPSPGYLKRPRSIYLNLPAEYQMIKIDSRKNLNDLSDNIFDILSLGIE